jgi:signal transduction histidine kinase
MCQHEPVFRRSASDRVIFGVAGGLGERLGIDPVVVRLAVVVLSLAGGVGVLAYLLAAVLARPPDPRLAAVRPRTSTTQAISIGLIVTGVLLLLRGAGLWFGDRIVWPASIVALGSAIIWTRGDETDRVRWARLWSRLPASVTEPVSGRGSRIRLLAGAGLIAVGLVAFLTSNRPLELLGNAPAAVAAVLVGLGVTLGPWVWRLALQVAEERRERIRSQERAEMAAHLHDSVLQTLALIQRTEDPAEMVALARGQERELRAWLYGKAPGARADSLSAALDAAAAEVERTHRTPIEVVLVGDCPLDDGVRALVHACREAMVNAARHSRTRRVSVYVEVEDDRVVAFVRDQGVGFDRGAVPADRRGIAESIEGRMERNGGVAVIETAPGRGTEVRLAVPRSRT